MTTNDADAFLGAAPPPPGFKFEQVGDTISGLILDRAMAQQREFKPKGAGMGELLTWPDGSPKMQAVLTVQADGVEPTAEDDGRRRVFIKGKNLTVAFRDAVQRASYRGSVVGCRIGVTFTSFGESTGANPPKVYTVKFAVPAARVDEVAPEATSPELDEFSEEPF